MTKCFCNFCGNFDCLTCIKGPRGPHGPIGATGKNGASAYEVAVANGFIGSEQQWLESLQGEQGPTGPTGTFDGDELFSISLPALPPDPDPRVYPISLGDSILLQSSTIDIEVAQVDDVATVSLKCPCQLNY